jgi:beta-glucuronidase
MNRIFREHKIRLVESLDGRWLFEPVSPPKPYRKTSGTILVPSAWETVPGLEAYRGKAIYGRPIEIRLVFGGVSHTADVYIDGEKMGRHYDAFSPWAIVSANLESGTHELTVEVDNSFGEDSALHRENDYYSYGGITRPVELHHVPSVYIERMHARPRRTENGWTLELRVDVFNWSDASQNRDLVVSLSETTDAIRFDRITIPAHSKQTFFGEIRVSGVKEWNLGDPNLYHLSSTLYENDTPVDDLIDRVGFRDIAIVGKEIRLNGKSIRLRGFNRHEDHPQFGCAIPVEGMATDLELIVDTGANFVRTSHYPNDRRFLDQCDEMGLAVWEESHARCLPFDIPNFDEQIETSTREMVEWHFNHPSIVIWGCLNECDSSTEPGRQVYERVLGQLRSLDDSRPVTFASSRQQGDICFGLVDIVCVNRYDAWYSGDPDRVQPELERFLEWMHSDTSRGGSGKPLILSEFGAAALYGNRQRCASKWSEEYQCMALEASLDAYLNHPDVAGAAIWQFCDCRVTKECWRDRARTMNNKGVVDEYRRPKQSYDVVKRYFLEASEKEMKSRQ